jgi:hypothetical protein
MMMWLPFWRTCEKPFVARILQTSLPDKTLNLPNSYFHSCDKNLFM